MCGGSNVQDNSHLVAQENRLAAEAAREAEIAETIRQEQEFEQRLSNAFTGARGNVESFFEERGLDPSQYESQISRGLNSAKANVPYLDTSPGTFFDGLGQSIFDSGSTALQSSSDRALDEFAYDGFARNLIGDDLDDSSIAAILDEQFANASEYGDGLLKRGVITNSGYAGALEQLEQQRGAAQRRMTELGDAYLESGRGDLRDIATDGRSNASRLELGDTFDPFQYQTQINDSFDSFVSGLGDNLRTFVPDDLFDISDFAVNAGSASGAQNTAFDPAALNGIFETEEEGDEEDEAFNLSSIF